MKRLLLAPVPLALGACIASPYVTVEDGAVRA